MMTKGNSPRLPHADPGCLQPVPLAELAAAYAAWRRDGCSRADAAAALSDLCVSAEPALEQALSEGLVVERDGLLHAAAVGKSGHRSAAWGDAKRDFAFLALGYPPPSSKGARAQRDLAAAALRRLFGLDNLPASPSRAEARCELLRRIAASFGEPFAARAAHPAGSFSFDPMSRSIYLAFAGLEAGTVLQADAALLSTALGGPAATVAELSVTILRAALRKKEEAFDLDGFTQSITKLARRLETKPYAGCVAIAQVYDAGLAEGLELGTLDEFKVHLAEAAREGLLDLERYDIAGPFDACLKERSRLRMGRDERHFIVNQSV